AGSGVDGEGWHWTAFDFLFMGTLLFGTGLVYELVAGKGGTIAYRLAVGLAAVTAFLLIWINAAVGLIGDGPINMLYLLVPLVALVGGLVARFQPRGLSKVLYLTALVQLLIPVLALLLGEPDFAP